MRTIGFIGLGVMGASMARNLVHKGFSVHAWARHPEKVAFLKEDGIVFHETLKEAVKQADVVITMVGFPQDVEDLYFRENGIFESMKPHALAVDMTTSDPDLAVRLYEEGKKRGMAVLDAPVTGGDAGARNGTLTILVGGDSEAFEAMVPVFEAMGSNIRYMGEAGAGQKAKLANQILIAGAMAGVAEAWAYAQNCGLDGHDLYEALKNGAAGSKSLDLYWPRLEKEDLKPGFFIKHFIKDMKLARKQAADQELSLPVLDLVLQEYEELPDPEEGTQALVRHYQDGNQKKNRN